MNNEKWSKYKKILTAFSVLIGLLAIPSIYSVFNRPYAGFWTDPNHMVLDVFANGPAEKAGLEVGNILKARNGVAMTDAKTRYHQPIPRVGDTVALTVERAGVSQDITLQLTAMPAKFIIRRLMWNINGIGWLLVAYLLYLKKPCRSTFVFLSCSLCAIYAFFFSFWGIDSHALRMLYDITGTIAGQTALALAAYYFMVFPQRKALLDRKGVLPILIVPALVAILFCIVFWIFHPDATGPMRYLYNNLVMGGSGAFYLLWCVWAVGHSYLKATSQERKNQGLNVLIAGILAGFGPALLILLMDIIAPQVGLPGGTFYGLTLIFIPISVGIAILKTEGQRTEDG